MTSLIKRDNGRMPVTFGSVVDQIFQDNLNRFFDDDLLGPNPLTGSQGTGNVPVNIRETDKAYEIELYSPGLNKNDFSLNIEGDMLTVSAEKKSENKQEVKGKWVKEEYRFSGFSRSFSLGDTVDAAKITARYDNGVLFLLIPKKENAQRVSRAVEIQ